MLSVLKPDHKYFRKDFVPKRAIDKILIDNNDGFLDGLPLGRFKKRIGSVFQEPEENRLKRQLALYKRRMAKHEDRLIELANEKDSDSEDVDDDPDHDGGQSSDDGPLETSSQIFKHTG